MYKKSILILFLFLLSCNNNYKNNLHMELKEDNIQDNSKTYQVEVLDNPDVQGW